MKRITMKKKSKDVCPKSKRPEVAMLIYTPKKENLASTSTAVRPQLCIIAPSEGVCAQRYAPDQIRTSDSTPSSVNGPEFHKA